MVQRVGSLNGCVSKKKGKDNEKKKRKKAPINWTAAGRGERGGNGERGLVGENINRF